MKVKLLISRAGYKFAQNAGDVVEVPEDEAKRLFEKGHAEPVQTKKETATKKAPISKRVK